MPEIGFEEQNQQRAGFRTRDLSPDSFIFAGESNLSLFSSASGSVDRSSFASDIHDHDSLVSEEHLAGHDLREASSGPDSDPNKSTGHWNSRLSRKVQKEKVPKEDSESEIGDKNGTVASARNSFSQALKECQDKKSRCGILPKMPDRRMTTSLELNNQLTNATTSLPGFGVMKKSSVMTQPTGISSSPGTPRHSSVGIQKGWSLERMPSHNNANRRHLGGAALLPLSIEKMLPSKWEDAERWIFSPISGDGVVKPSFQQPKYRPKSKSGPLGPPRIANYPLHSPATPIFEGSNVQNSLIAGSPFSAGVIAADGLSIHSGVGSGGAGIFPTRMEPCMMARSISVHGCSELLIQSSLPGPQDGKRNGDKDAATHISQDASKKDMATQMSPEGSPHSSPRRRPSLSLSISSVLPIVELERVESSILEVRDVQVDGRVTVTRWSKKNRERLPGKGSENVDDSQKKAGEVQPSAWEVAEAAKSFSKMKREEAKITEWENLQKAKAEAAMKKLEMKLEKRRLSSLDKIMNKLRSAQKKAQEMRSSVVTNQPHQLTRTSSKVISLHRPRPITSLSGCFTCHAF